MKNTVKVITVMLALSVTSVFAADWPWIYGPRRDHTSDQKGLLRTWAPGGPKVGRKLVSPRSCRPSCSIKHVVH
jgi:hypothetical protein